MPLERLDRPLPTVLNLPISMMSPSGASARLTMLTFHRVLPQPDPLYPELPSAAEFEQQMGWVRRWFNVMPLAEAIDRLYAGTLPARALSITFDDGYADNEQVAAPILKRLGLHATFFVATGYLDGSCMWNDAVVHAIRACPGPTMDLQPLGLKAYDVSTTAQRQGTIVRLVLDIKHHDAPRRGELVAAILASQNVQAPSGLMMRPAQLVALRDAGMAIGAHTVTHPILTRIPAAQARAEIGESREHLEGLLGQPVRLFAYPNGMPRRDYAAEHAVMVQACGFDAAVTTAAGAAATDSDRYQLPRFAPWDRARWKYGVRLLQNLRGPSVIAA